VPAVLLQPAWLILAEIPAAPVLAVMTFALVITVMGHINKNYRIVGIGLVILFLATFVMVGAAYIDYNGGTDKDPRPCGVPAAC
jgi:hypothetical protein